MRVIKTCRFNLGTKIPFSSTPSIVHRFIEEQNLVYQRFMYFFDELVFTEDTFDELSIKGSCEKAVKDCPKLGKIRPFNGEKFRIFSTLFLSNIDIDTGCTEADILPNMTKIHRRYGFSEANLYYYDINFFNSVIPFERDMSYVKSYADGANCEPDPSLGLENQPYGSGIRLHRFCTGDNIIIMSVDMLHDGRINDPTPYFDAMNALLPNVRPVFSMQIYLSEDEKQNIEIQNERFAPTLEKIRLFFADLLPQDFNKNHFLSKYKLAPKLKTLADQYGYTYQFSGNGTYNLCKRTSKGHILRLNVDSGPSRFGTSYSLYYEGIGFKHSLTQTYLTPTNQAESDACSEMVLAAVSKFEKAFISQLDEFYDETPEWYIPSRL